MSFSRSFERPCNMSGAAHGLRELWGESVSKVLAQRLVDEGKIERSMGLLFVLIIFLGLIAGSLLWPATAKADTIYVRDTMTESGVTGDAAQAANALIRSAIANHPGETLTANEAGSKVQLQPRLLKLGDVFLLTLEKTVNGEIVYVAQTKFPRITELDQAARRTVMTVLAEPLASYKKSGIPRYPSAPFSDQQIRPSMTAPAGGDKAQTTTAKDQPAEDTTAGRASRDQRLSSAANPTNPQPEQSVVPMGQSTAPPVGEAEPSNDGAPLNNSVSNSANSSVNSGAANVVAPPAGSANAPTDTRGDMARSSRQVSDVTSQFPDRKSSRWLIGIGPMVSRHMAADSVMYGLAGAFVWDLSPFLSTKVQIEANLSTSADLGQYFNAAVGGNYYFVSRIENAPYVTADVGYGYASSLADGYAEGFSLGLGAGYELLRTTTNPLDLSVRFSTIFSGMNRGSGDPSVLGARVAVSI